MTLSSIEPDRNEAHALKHTPLYAKRVGDASSVINLKGFARAMHHRGHIAEHWATRETATLWDVSHMGEINFEDTAAHLSTNIRE